MDHSNGEQNLTARYRMMGAVVWLLLLIVIVPSWYNDPVNFSPDQPMPASNQGEQKVLVDKPFLLPNAQKASDVKSGENTMTDSPERQTVKKPSGETKKKAKEVDHALTSAKVANKQADTVTEASASASNGTQWIIRVVAYRSKEKADFLSQRLKYDYEVFVKYFPKSKYYSVRVGPYQDKREALKDQQSLNRILHIRSEVAKLK